MNPNQPEPHQKYSVQFKTSPLSPYQQSTQHTQYLSNGNTLNLPKNTYTFTTTQYSPTDNYTVNKTKIDRAMYTSTIESTQPSKTFNLGKLQSMGRFVQNPHENVNQNNKSSFQYTPVSNQQYQRTNFTNQQPKQYEPVSQNHKFNDFQRFPAFNLQKQQFSHQNSNNNLYQPVQIQKTEPPQNTNENLTPEQKRRRQILAIKQQLDLINKKMENSNLSKKFSPQVQQNGSISQQKFIPNKDFLNPMRNNDDHSNFVPVKNEINSPSSNGLSFAKNTNKLETIQRGKGMIAQSMIVSTEPSPGYKYQSIFDKYESLQKPVYETSNKGEIKEPQGSLLDKFVNKGPGSFANKQFNETNFNNQNNGINTFNTTISTNTVNYGQTVNKQSFDFGQKKPVQPINDYKPYNFNASSSSSTSTSSSSSSSLNSASTNSNGLSSETNKVESGNKEGPNMFKKKKVNFEQQIKIQTIISDTTKNNSKTDYITEALKQMKIQESVQFKKEDFIVGKKLGKGQFGEVMLVQHKKTGFICGMKVMEKKQIRDQKYQGQIARQLSIQFYLAHRNIAPLYGYFQDEKNVYLLVEYCTGGQLLEMLRKNRRMQEPEVSRVIRQIIEGIDYIHKELIIHRDIKPENILFNYGVAKICDFGWAVYKGHGMRKTASVGSPLYYSPEIVMGVEYDEKIDIWDIGMMTYECLLGKIPFRIYSELDLNRIVEDEIKFPEYIETSEEAKDFILKIMKKKPEERMEIREMLRHPFITKYQELKLPVEIMKDFKQVL